MSRELGVVNFGPYEPDSPDLYNPGLEGAINVVPRRDHFEPLPSPAPLSTSALPSRPLGAYACYDNQQNSFVFAGLKGSLYQYSGTTWNDASRVASPYNGGEDRWEFAKWGNLCVATSLQNNLQYIGLGQANFQDLVTGIGAHHVAVVRDFVMVGDVTDVDGLNPNRVRWCAFRDPFDWTPSATTQSDFRDLQGQSISGQINRIIGGEYALVFFADSIWRLSYVGPPTVFQADEIDPDIGTIAEGSIIQHAGRTFFLSEDGFRVTRGGVSQPIGHQKINRDVLQRLDYNHLNRISTSVFKEEQIIMWAIPGPGNVGGRPNFLVMYNFVHDRWSGGMVEVEYLVQGALPFISFDDPVVDETYGNSIENVPGSSDDKTWGGGNTEFLMFDENYLINNWRGAPLQAEFTTGEHEFHPGRRTAVSEIRPLVDLGGDLEVSIGYRNRQRDPVVWTTPRTENAHGIIPQKIDSRYMRFRARIPAGTEFEDTVGIQVYGALGGG